MGEDHAKEQIELKEKDSIVDDLNRIHADPTLLGYDFSRDLLTRARRLSAYVWPASLGWSDLGTPERRAEWHRRAETPGTRAGVTSVA